jgi:hypothetical protein
MSCLPAAPISGVVINLQHKDINELLPIIIQSKIIIYTITTLELVSSALFTR